MDSQLASVSEPLGLYPNANLTLRIWPAPLKCQMLQNAPNFASASVNRTVPPSTRLPGDIRAKAIYCRGAPETAIPVMIKHRRTEGNR